MVSIYLGVYFGKVVEYAYLAPSPFAYIYISLSLYIWDNFTARSANHYMQTSV